MIAHKAKIEALSETLLEMETLDLHSIMEVLGPRPFKLNKNFEEYIQTKEKMKEEGVPSQ